MATEFTLFCLPQNVCKSGRVVRTDQEEESIACNWKNAFALGSFIKKTVNMKTMRMKIRELKEANSVRYQKLLDDHTQVEELANSGRGKRKRTGTNNSDYIY